MKPLKLTMKAFLGFKEETVIDFRPLYEDKIFLITGATGAGKTSIFDAVSYALYGEGSGEDRTKAKCFRSQLADEKGEMEVALDFEVRGELFHVRRVETAKGLNKAYFYSEADPEKMFVKIREVNEEIEKIIGLNLDQFKKIVMIPQGEFREFLTAGTKDKSDILKKLFSTEKYEQLQWILKAKYDESKALDKSLILKFNEIVKESGITDRDIEMGPDALLEILTKEESELKVLDEEIKVLNEDRQNEEKNIRDTQKSNADLEDFQKVRDEYIKKKNQKRIFEGKTEELKLLRKISSITPTEKQLIQKDMEIRKLKENLAEITEGRKRLSIIMEKNKKNFEHTLSEFTVLDEKKTEKSKLEDLLLKSLRLNEGSKTLEKLTRDESELGRQLQYLKKRDEMLVELTNEERETSRELHEEEVREIQIKMKLQEGSARLKVLSNLYNKNQRRVEMEEKLILLKKEEENFERNLQVTQNAFDSEQKKRNQTYASLLRQELGENEPCPVCGSLEHPLVSKENHNFDEKKLKDLEASIKLLEKEVTQKKAEIRNHLDNHTALYEEILELSDENQVKTYKVDELRIIGSDEKEQYRRTENKRTECLSTMNKLKVRQGEQNAKMSSLKKELEVLEKIMLESDETKAKINDLKGELRTLIAQGVPKESTSIGMKIKDIERQIILVTENHEKAKKIYEESQNEDNRLSGRESALNGGLVDALEHAKDLQGQFLNELEKAEVTRETYEYNKQKVEFIEEIDEEIINFYKSYNASKGAFENLREHGEKLNFRDLNPLLMKLEETKAKLGVKGIEVGDKKVLILSLRNAHTKLKGIYDKYMGNKKSLYVLQDLYDTANLGMGFETFVQSYYFEGILIRANERLRKMSEGRYQLKRRNETENRREKIGLGLNVYDEYTGKERDVQSLSGGESFKASLSLALGLSDFIESHKGSVNLETIFIDEGFGSLDQDSLDNALECLLELNLSGRIVGIISHVTELKDRIPGKIDVRNVPGRGSVVSVNGGR
ncbi:MAG: AAA family ATPase [Clostridiaceae bacterium]